MARLSRALVQREVASLRDVEEALARQVLYGGDVVSNFLEQTRASVDEHVLTAVVADALELEAAPAGALPVATPELVRLVPREVADEHSLFPLARRGDDLRVAVAERLSQETEHDLAFALGLQIVQVAGLHVRIREALNRDYGVPLDRRTIRGIARLEGRADPMPSRLPSPLEGATDLASLPRPPLIPPIGDSGTHSLFAEEESRTPSIHEAITAPAPPVEHRREEPPRSSRPSIASRTNTPPGGTQAPAVPSVPLRKGTPAPTAAEPSTRTPASGTLAVRRSTPAPTSAPAQILTAPVLPSEPARRLTPASGPKITVAEDTATLDPSGRTLAAWSESERRAHARQSRLRHRGPYTAADAEKDLLEAEERDDVLGAFFGFAGQYFEYSALFAVVGDIAEGRDAHGPGASRSDVQAIGVPLELPSALSTARERLTPELLRLAPEGMDAQLARDLKREPGRCVLVVPVAVRGRCVVLLYGDDGDADVELSDVGEVIAFAPLVATALEAVIRRKKAAALTTMGPGALASLAPSPGPKPKARLPSIDERASALAEALEGPPVRSSSSPFIPAVSARRASERPPASTIPGSSHAAPQPPAPNLVPNAPPKPEIIVQQEEPPKAASLSPRAPAKPATGGAPQEPARPVISLETRAPQKPLGSLKPAAPAKPVFSLKPNAPEKPATALKPAAPAKPFGSLKPAAPAKPDPGLRSGAPPKPAGSLLPDVPPKPQADTARQGSRADGDTLPSITSVPPTQRAGGPEVRPPEPGTANNPYPLDRRAPPPSNDAPNITVEPAVIDEDILAAMEQAPVSVASSRPAKRYAPRDLTLPKVIVDIDDDAASAVNDLIAGRAGATEKLRAMGEAGVVALMAEFPGTVAAEAERNVTVRAAAAGPVLAALVHIGVRAAPFLLVRTNDANPTVRQWATRVLGEIPCVESAKAVARRAADSDERVQRAAREAGRLLMIDDEARAVLRETTCDLVSSASVKPDARMLAIEALATWRDPASVPRLLPFVNGSPDLAGSVRWALEIITRQSFGGDEAAWSSWWSANSERHRIEWLIDGLMHSDQEMRRQSSEELKTLTKEYFGYFEDLPEEERVLAQRRYLNWWDTTGRARFAHVPT